MTFIACKLIRAHAICGAMEPKDPVFCLLFAFDIRNFLFCWFLPAIAVRYTNV